MPGGCIKSGPLMILLVRGTASAAVEPVRRS